MLLAPPAYFGNPTAQHRYILFPDNLRLLQFRDLHTIYTAGYIWYHDIVGGITESLRNNKPFIEDILNGMYDWVRVIDRDNNVIYMNRAMREGLGEKFIGKKCYEVLGRNEPCTVCISRKSVFEGFSQEKEESIGDRTFSVMSSPVRNAAGEVVAAVEVLRETPAQKALPGDAGAEPQAEERGRNGKEAAGKPSSDPGHSGLDFSLLYMPCESLGGDFVDIFRIDDSHIGVYIADVSGHGVQASLLTVFLRSAVNKSCFRPPGRWKSFYEFNKSKLDQEMHITMFLLDNRLDDRTMLYSNAGLNVLPVVYGRQSSNC